ncbi:TonB-dependent receptor plug domain-containing protein [Niabella insulamsoli]|uniref:TonB-dependent receptor plug domain-containing protein n=1 Tax=Niabella insulamsoli TaxID=3144874 RepID=UPI0031FDF6BA
MKKGFISWLGLMQIITAFNSADAQQTTLDPVTITSSLSEKRSSETGRNMTIINGSDIAKLPVHSLDELLKYVPGIEVQSRGPQGAQSDISIRGGTYQQVLVVLDGLRINDPNSGHFSAYIPITPAQIDRIEILKGASAAIYGSDAVGGVINIVTKAFNAQNQQKDKLLNGQLALGEYNLVNTNVGGFVRAGKWSVDAGLLSNHATGVQKVGTRGFFHNTTASAGFNVRLNEYWNLSARSVYDHRDFDAQNFYTTYLSDTATELVKSWWHQARLSYQKNKSGLSIDAGYKTLSDQYAFNSISPANQNESKLFQSLLLFHQQLGQQTLLTTGFNFQNRAIVSNDRGTHSLNIAAPFASLTQQIGDHFNLMPSLRVEWIGNNQAEILPQLNASLRLKDVQLRASGGRTVRAAEFTERYNNYNRQTPIGRSIGNPWLTPEVSWGYEAGFDWFSKGVLKVSSTVFQRFHSKLIDWVFTPYDAMPRKDNLTPGTDYYLATNIARINTTGFETDVQYRARFAEKQMLFLNAGMVWLYSKSSEANPSFYTSSHARFLSNFNLQYEVGKWGVSLTGLYKVRNQQQAPAINAHISKDYFLLNARAKYSFLKDRLAAFAQVDNVLDRNYSDLLGSVMPGRWLQGGISFSCF